MNPRLCNVLVPNKARLPASPVLSLFYILLVNPGICKSILHEFSGESTISPGVLQPTHAAVAGSSGSAGR